MSQPEGIGSHVPQLIRVHGQSGIVAFDELPAAAAVTGYGVDCQQGFLSDQTVFNERSQGNQEPCRIAARVGNLSC